MRSTVQKKTYTVAITEDVDGFVGRCDELHANSDGDTYGEIMENMKEVVELAAEACGNSTNFNLLVVQK